MSSPVSESGRRFLRVRCRSVVDPVKGEVGCCLLAERVENLSLAWRVLAVGEAGEVSHHPAAAHAAEEVREDCVVFPGLVNAHTHLDLTHIGPREYRAEDGFVSWVDMIRRERLREDEEIAESVRRGIELVKAGGTVAAGDIAGSSQGRYTLAPWRALRESGLLGVSYIECFGIGKHRAGSAERLEALVAGHGGEIAGSQAERARVGLQPHAPNTVEIGHYLHVVGIAERLGAPLATHLAETAEEREFIASGMGGQRELLERLGVWDDSVLEQIGRGLHPVRHMEPVLSRAKFLAAHCNDATDEAIGILAATGTSVAYCPRASEYFGAAQRFGPHRYRDLLRAGVNVCLGTDSLVNLPYGAADPGRGGMSVLDEMRLLFRRDGTDPVLLLRMGTVNGARGLGFDPGAWCIGAGSRPEGLLWAQAGSGERGGRAMADVLKGDGRAAFLR